MRVAPLLDTQVVVGADTGEGGQFFTSQPPDASARAGDKSDIFWPDLATSQSEVLTERVTAGHDLIVAEGGFASTQDERGVPRPIPDL